MFISCQILLVLLEAIRGVPDRLPRVARHPVDALRGDFRHEPIKVSIWIRSILHLRRVRGTLAQDAVKLFMLVTPLHICRSPEHLERFVVTLGGLHLRDARRVLRIDALFVLARLSHSTFRDAKSAGHLSWI